MKHSIIKRLESLFREHGLRARIEGMRGSKLTEASGGGPQTVQCVAESLEAAEEVENALRQFGAVRRGLTFEVPVHKMAAGLARPKLVALKVAAAWIDANLEAGCALHESVLFGVDAGELENQLRKLAQSLRHRGRELKQEVDDPCNLLAASTDVEV